MQAHEFHDCASMSFSCEHALWIAWVDVIGESEVRRGAFHGHILQFFFRGVRSYHGVYVHLPRGDTKANELNLKECTREDCGKTETRSSPPWPIKPDIHHWSSVGSRVYSHSDKSCARARLEPLTGGAVSVQVCTNLAGGSVHE